MTVQGDPNGTPVPISYEAATWVNHSGTITAGGGSQSLMPANLQRRGFWVQNHSVETLWIMENAVANAGQPSIQIPANGGYYESPPSGVPVAALQILGATTGSAFSCREW